MPSKYRRFEILFPHQFNDGSNVPDELLGEALTELFEAFEAASFETQSIEGRWRSGGTTYRDSLARAFVDIPDTEENRQWMKAYRDRWKVRFRQLELWLGSCEVNVE